MTQEMCSKAVNTCFFIFEYARALYEAQEMCDRVVFEDSFFVVYCSDKYITQKMCDEGIDDSLTTLKLIPDWFITIKLIKNLLTVLFADENILCFNEDSGNAVFICNGMGILNIGINNINLDNNFDEDDPDTIILIRLLAWHIKFERRKELKKYISKKLIPVAWHSNRGGSFACQRMRKKK